MEKITKDPEIPKDPETPKDPNKASSGEKEDPKNPGEKDLGKPGVKVPSKDDIKIPSKSQVDRDRIIKKADKKIVLPNESQIVEKGKLSPEDRTKIEEKIKEKNPDIVDAKVDEHGNVSLSFKDGTRAELSAKDLLK